MASYPSMSVCMGTRGQLSAIDCKQRRGALYDITGTTPWRVHKVTLDLLMRLGDTYPNENHYKAQLSIDFNIKLL